MDKTVPAGAALLLGFIYETETSLKPPECYEVIYGHNQHKLKKPITSMTLDEVEAAQASWSKRFGSSATGAAQFMKNTLDAPRTLRDIEGEMGLTGKERFSPDLQDRMAFHLLKRRGYEAFIAGRISRTEFGKRLAQEWASFPVLAPTKGAHRNVKRGQTYYAGDGLNKALVAPETVEGVLDQVKKVAALPVQPVPAPEPIIVEKPVVKDPEQLDKPLTGSKTIWTYITIIFTAIASIFERLNFIDLDWRVQIFMLAVVIGLAGYGIYARRRIARVYREIKAEFGGA